MTIWVTRLGLLSIRLETDMRSNMVRFLQQNDGSFRCLRFYRTKTTFLGTASTAIYQCISMCCWNEIHLYQILIVLSMTFWSILMGVERFTEWRFVSSVKASEGFAAIALSLTFPRKVIKLHCMSMVWTIFTRASHNLVEVEIARWM
jgi:hypothetical protein